MKRKLNCLCAVALAASFCSACERSAGPESRPATAALRAARLEPKTCIAHRGASAYAPEHTLTSYALAIEMGAEYVEQDLQLTKDGVLVCLHDTTLNRTTNAATVFPDRFTHPFPDEPERKGWRVADFTLEEIKRLDAGSWLDAEFTGERVPTFQEAIDLVRGKAGIYPELKAPGYYDALGMNMEAEVKRVLEANGLHKRLALEETPVLIQSFSPEALRNMSALAGDAWPLIQLVSGRQADELLSDDGLATVAQYAFGIGPSISLIADDRSRVAAAHGLGLAIHPYTVNWNNLPDLYPDARAYMDYLLYEIGVDGVFTDNPDLFPRW